MTQMPNITVNRYHDPNAIGYLASISPSGEAWIVFVQDDGVPTLWRRTEMTTNEGKTVQGYVCDINPAAAAPPVL